MEALLTKHTPNLQIQIHQTVTSPNTPYFERMSCNFNKLCVSLCFIFYNILFFSCDKCSCTTGVCSGDVAHLALGGAAIERHLPHPLSPLCPPAPRHIYTSRSLHSRAFSLSLSFTSYQNGDASFPGLFIRYLLDFHWVFSCLLSRCPLYFELPKYVYKTMSLFSFRSFLKALLSYDVCRNPDNSC